MGGTEERVYKWACGNFEGRGRDMFIFLNVFYWLILEREKRRERDRNIDLLCLLVKHLLFDSCMCPDPGWNPQPWCLGMTLTNWAPCQGLFIFLIVVMVSRVLTYVQTYQIVQLYMQFLVCQLHFNIAVKKRNSCPVHYWYF